MNLNISQGYELDNIKIDTFLGKKKKDTQNLLDLLMNHYFTELLKDPEIEVSPTTNTFQYPMCTFLKKNFYF